MICSVYMLTCNLFLTKENILVVRNSNLSFYEMKSCRVEAAESSDFPSNHNPGHSLSLM